MRRRKIHYGDRYGVSAYVPPKETQRIAEERTEGMVGYFLSCASRHPVKWQDQLYTLARSCYLQGLHDMLDASLRVREAERREKTQGG